jgi:hypothetical protein
LFVEVFAASYSHGGQAFGAIEKAFDCSTGVPSMFAFAHPWLDKGRAGLLAGDNAQDHSFYSKW